MYVGFSLISVHSYYVISLKLLVLKYISYFFVELNHALTYDAGSAR